MILERLSEETGVGMEDLRVIMRSASYRYRTYTIPKRDGGRREISQPTPAVKFHSEVVVSQCFVPFSHS